MGNVRNWWLFLLRGLALMALGMYMIQAPVASIMVFSFLFGVIIIFTGIAELLHAYTNRYIVGWSWRFFLGLIDLALGILLVADVRVSNHILPFALGTWFLFRGFSLLSFGSVIRRSAWLLIGGIVIIVFALSIIVNPAFGMMTVVLWTACTFIVTGIFNIMLAFKLKATNDVLTR